MRKYDDIKRKRESALTTLQLLGFAVLMAALWLAILDAFRLAAWPLI